MQLETISGSAEEGNHDISVRITQWLIARLWSLNWFLIPMSEESLAPYGGS